MFDRAKNIHLRVHEWDDGTLVLSMDLMKHMGNLPPQHDILDMLLRQPQPKSNYKFVLADCIQKVAEEAGEVEVEAGEVEAEEVEAAEEPHATSPVTVIGNPAVVDAVVEEPVVSRTNAFGFLSGKGPTRELVVRYDKTRTHHDVITDALIYKYVEVHGPHWRDLALSLGGRSFGFSDDAVRNRYIRILAKMGRTYKPRFKRKSITKVSDTNRPWTPEEDALLHNGIQQYGNKWSKIIPLLHYTRTWQAIRNRANRTGLILESMIKHVVSDC